MCMVNANYSQYFNRKYNRSGHLWQDRYKSKFITSEDYLYTLIRYIENNPIEVGCKCCLEKK
jgi:REP element-mobilizing transposase RayT